jgi:hypothetical protein
MSGKLGDSKPARPAGLFPLGRFHPIVKIPASIV